YHGAYIAEVVRAGIQSIGRGQLEAALSQGFTYVTAMRYIIIPQAMRIVLPPLTNQAVNLIKNTSVIAIIAGGDLMYAGDSFAGRYGHYGPTYVLVGLGYFLMCFPLAVLTRRLEERTRAA
ncbi:MAG: amino acid ABC transporter permease, partial [Actinomycetota bacterium]|nr:amino acid ABC transporter permease [Actinomycetota bacterium]